MKNPINPKKVKSITNRLEQVEEIISGGTWDCAGRYCSCQGPWLQAGAPLMLTQPRPLQPGPAAGPPGSPIPSGTWTPHGPTGCGAAASRPQWMNCRPQRRQLRAFSSGGSRNERRGRVLVQVAEVTGYSASWTPSGGKGSTPGAWGSAVTRQMKWPAFEASGSKAFSAVSAEYMSTLCIWK